MPYNGTGNFSPPASPYFPTVPGTVIESGKFNYIITDIATGLSNCLTRDGQTRWAGHQRASGFRLQGLGDGLDPSDAVTKQQLDEKLDANGGEILGNLSIAPTSGEAKVTVTYPGGSYVKLYTDNLTEGLWGSIGSFLHRVKVSGKKYLFGEDLDTFVRAGSTVSLNITGNATSADTADTATSATLAENSNRLGGKLPADFWQKSEGTANLSAVGGDKLPDGLVFRWGTIPAGDGVQTITFDTPFPNACFGVFPSIRSGGSADPEKYKVYVGVPTLTNCTIDISGIGSPGGYYFAIGK